MGNVGESPGGAGRGKVVSGLRVGVWALLGALLLLAAVWWLRAPKAPAPEAPTTTAKPAAATPTAAPVTPTASDAPGGATARMRGQVRDTDGNAVAGAMRLSFADVAGLLKD